MDKIKAEYEELTQKIKQNLPIKALPKVELVSRDRKISAETRQKN